MITIGGLGGWAATTEISGAIIAAGLAAVGCGDDGEETTADAGPAPAPSSAGLSGALGAAGN